MGSKSFRYEVLVYPPKEQTQSNAMTSSNSDTQSFFQTQIQRFTCDRENMRQYWIPEGFHPVLVPRTYLQSSLSAANNENTRQIMTTSASVANAQMLPNGFSNVNVPSRPLQPRIATATSNIIIGGGGVMTQSMKRRFPAKDQIITPPPRSLNAQMLYYFQKRRELIENRSLNRPSKTIEQMWQEESVTVKRHYERLALRIKIEQALSSRACHLRQRRHQPYNINRNNSVTSLTGSSSRVIRSRHLQNTMSNMNTINNAPFNVNGSSLNRSSFDVSSTTENHFDITNKCNAISSSSQGVTPSHVLNLNSSSVSSYRSVQNENASNIVGNDCTSSSDTEDSDEFFEESRNDFMNADNPYGEPFESPISSPSSSPKFSATRTNDDYDYDNDYDYDYDNDYPNKDWMTHSDYDTHNNSDAEYEDDNEGLDY
ncbi:MATA-HMG [Gigaspora margarita]|uniref:MATA-HMG n=1 Tax=Gigaspora margarita TaxID=4874 RepID=A0A8H3XAW5_GIGMA|nr:MATA-HMG [Gigaspora margarita]